MSKETKDNKKKRKEYHLMLFIDNHDGMIRQLGIESIIVEIFAGVLALIIAISIIGWAVNSVKRKSVQAENAALATRVEQLQASVDDLTAQNTSLTNKVTILSDTVNSKVEAETAVKEESDTAHFPDGFPLSTSASMVQDADDPNYLTFSCNEGASIIAAGAGTVIEVLPDPDYGYCTRIDHENGYITEYYSSATPLIKEGDSVLQGGIIAVVESNDSKLIYKVYLDDKLIDPMTVIKIDG